MKTYLNEISGLWNAIDTLYLSKRSWTREKEEHIKAVYADYFDRWGMRTHAQSDEMKAMIDKTLKWAAHHITIGRFIDFAFTVKGLHRGAQDDFDSHTARFNNRIIRSSTRLADYGNEKSAWYQGKILTTEEVASSTGIVLPDTYTTPSGETYIRAANGYVLQDLQGDKDVLRGLLPLSIPSNFLVRVNATEFAHVLKQRDKNSHAAPELRDCVESMLTQIEAQVPQLNRDFFYKVEN